MSLEFVVEIEIEILDGHDRSLSNDGHHRSLSKLTCHDHRGFELFFEKRPVMTIMDFDFDFDEQFESHLLLNRLYHLRMYTLIYTKMCINLHVFTYAYEYVHIYIYTTYVSHTKVLHMIYNIYTRTGVIDNI